MPLYHYQLGLPAIPDSIKTGTFKLIWTNHAKQEANKDYIEWQTFGDVSMRHAKIIEQEHCGMSNRLLKLVIRLPFDDLDDAVLAVIPEGKKLVVKTIWLNSVEDKHETLNVSRYAKL